MTMNRIRINITLLLLILLSSCHLTNYESDIHYSPTKNYFIKGTVNRTDEKKENFADVIIHIYNKNKSEIQLLNSHAGDTNKWALGWTKVGDTILLQSSDIGNQAWTISNGQFKKVEMNTKIEKLAEELYKEKYK
jgi:hypothetical protein